MNANDAPVPQTRRAGDVSLDQVVRIGEARHATQGLLRATLGSCVGIGLIWRSRRRCVLAHCLLPSAPMPGQGPAYDDDRDPRYCARYVDRTLPVLFRLLEIERSAYHEIEAVLVGGASLAKLGRGAAGQIGRHNIDAARARLGAAGLRVVLEQIGGEKGWQVTIDATQLSASAREIGEVAAATPSLNSTRHEVSHGHARTR